MHQTGLDPGMNELPGLELREPPRPARRGHAGRGEVVRASWRAAPPPARPRAGRRSPRGHGARGPGCRRRRGSRRRPRARAQLERDLAARADFRDRGHGLAQVPFEGVALAIGRLGDAELVQHSAASSAPGGSSSARRR